MPRYKVALADDPRRLVILPRSTRYKSKAAYWAGLGPAHYPVPAIPVCAGFQTADKSQQFPSSYWWITSRTMLWTCFEKWGLIKEYSA